MPWLPLFKQDLKCLNHNTETVSRLYRRVRPYANYEQTLNLLRTSKQLDAQMLTKSGVMVGLGETVTELLETMEDLRSTECDILTIGQYLSPSARHLPIQRYYTPEEFEELKEAGIEMGFRHVESGPLSAELLSRRRTSKDNPKLTASLRFQRLSYLQSRVLHTSAKNFQTLQKIRFLIH